MTRARRLLAVLCAIAFVPRVASALHEPAYLHPDALYQALEPAFRLIHGYGVMTWEWHEGVRSWLWPGFLSTGFGLADLFDPKGAAASIAVTRVLVACIDIAGVWAAARLAYARAGAFGAIAASVVLASQPTFVVMGAQPLIDVPAAACLAWACERAFASKSLDRRRALWLGVALGTVIALRIQLAPAALAVLIAIRWLPDRPEIAPGGWRRIAAGIAGPLLAAGLLDWVTWGRPFSSTVAYLAYNLTEGQTAFGVMPADRYAHHFWLAMNILAPVLVGLALWGARRCPGLALVVLAVVVPHQLIPYKVWRFMHPALPALVVLAAIGAADAIQRLRAARPAAAAALSVTLGLTAAASATISWGTQSLWKTTWLYNQGGGAAVALSRGVNRAYLAASRRHVGTLAETVLPSAASPGLALLGQNARVLYPLDRPGDRAALPSAGTWIVFEQDPHSTAPGFRRIWRDTDTGVALYQRRHEAVVSSRANP